MTQVDQVVSGLLTDLYVEGTALPAAAGGRFDVLDPAIGTVIASVADGGVGDRGRARLHGVALPGAQLVR